MSDRYIDYDRYVSIHPRLFRRGNPNGSVTLDTYTLFQSTPAFSGEGTMEKLVKMLYPKSFQSTPAFSGEGTGDARVVAGYPPVSIHPRLFRRGNLLLPFHLPMILCFNPPPPFQAREREFQ